MPGTPSVSASTMSTLRLASSPTNYRNYSVPSSDIGAALAKAAGNVFPVLGPIYIGWDYNYTFTISAASAAGNQPSIPLLALKTYSGLKPSSCSSFPTLPYYTLGQFRQQSPILGYYTDTSYMPFSESAGLLQLSEQINLTDVPSCFLFQMSTTNPKTSPSDLCLLNSLTPPTQPQSQTTPGQTYANPFNQYVSVLQGTIGVYDKSQTVCYWNKTHGYGMCKGTLVFNYKAGNITQTVNVTNVTPINDSDPPLPPTPDPAFDTRCCSYGIITSRWHSC